jgi:dTDP-glucose 4,6-dehydratase
MGKSFEQCTEIVGERPGQDAAYVIDSARARARFAWAPKITLDQGLTEVIDWVNANWEEIASLPLIYEHKA